MGVYIEFRSKGGVHTGHPESGQLTLQVAYFSWRGARALRYETGSEMPSTKALHYTPLS